MEKIKKLLFELPEKLQKLTSIPPLLFRLILAYGFYGPATMKIQDVDAIASWFTEMGIPAPTLNAYLATYTEFFGFILLTLGLATRYISIPLIITLIVAIKTVHWENGFNSGDNGFEIPLYYIIMLLALVINGPGKLSLDFLIKKFMSKKLA